VGRLESINRLGIMAQGRKELIKHLKGGPISRKEAMVAKCYDCMGYYADGRADCEILDCPLYPFNPAGEKWKMRERKEINSKTLKALKKSQIRKQKVKEVSRHG